MHLAKAIIFLPENIMVQLTTIL